MGTKLNKILRGIIFYLAGLAIGSVAVHFLWVRNRTDLLSWWPGGRVKDKILRSNWLHEDAGMCYLNCYQLNDSVLNHFIKNGNVRFGISKTRRKPFPVYIIDGIIHNDMYVRMHIESADSLASVFRIEDLPETKKKVNCPCYPITY
ncbi:MAG: hypothetical protein N2167_07955 [Flavobacteriales bacterium]|nr:hypothetical protein [Flavobacteriales bacterium]